VMVGIIVATQVREFLKFFVGQRNLVRIQFNKCNGKLPVSISAKARSDAVVCISVPVPGFGSRKEELGCAVEAQI